MLCINYGCHDGIFYDHKRIFKNLKTAPYFIAWPSNPVKGEIY